MPHITFTNNQSLLTPCLSNGVNFQFVAKSYNKNENKHITTYKIAVINDEKNFLISLNSKSDSQMIKYDKITRVTPIKIIKDALNEFVQITKADITFTNAINDSSKIEIVNTYLKDINFFVHTFQTNKEIQIEVGFGSGRHLIHQAKNNPDIQFIGIEIHTPSIEQVLKQIQIQEIKNILIVNYDARLFLEFIKSNSVGKVFVHFPVPWDKKPHRRVYSDDFISEVLRVLKIDATVELRTDSRKYFDYCIQLLTSLNSGEIMININKELEVTSKYEDRWKKQGKNIYDITLKCKNLNDELKSYSDFSFNININKEYLLKKLSSKPFVYKDFFVHFEEVYIVQDEEDSFLIKVTFGSFNRSLSKYILIRNAKVSYYQGDPIPTSANINAHKKIKEILQDD